MSQSKFNFSETGKLCVALILLALSAGCSDSPINVVKNGVLAEYPAATIGDVLEHNFKDTKWSYEKENARLTVIFEGKIPKKLHEKAVRKYTPERVNHRFSEFGRSGHPAVQRYREELEKKEKEYLARIEPKTKKLMSQREDASREVQALNNDIRSINNKKEDLLREQEDLIRKKFEQLSSDLEERFIATLDKMKHEKEKSESALQSLYGDIPTSYNYAKQYGVTGPDLAVIYANEEAWKRKVSELKAFCEKLEHQIKEAYEPHLIQCSKLRYEEQQECGVARRALDAQFKISIDEIEAKVRKKSNEISVVSDELKMLSEEFSKKIEEPLKKRRMLDFIENDIWPTGSSTVMKWVVYPNGVDFKLAEISNNSWAEDAHWSRARILDCLYSRDD
jgi:hypothetical protein